MDRSKRGSACSDADVMSAVVSCPGHSGGSIDASRNVDCVAASGGDTARAPMLIGISQSQVLTEPALIERERNTIRRVGIC